MLRPSPNHGTLWLHNDDDDIYIVLCLVCPCVEHCRFTILEELVHFNFIKSFGCFNISIGDAGSTTTAVLVVVNVVHMLALSGWQPV